MKVLQVLPTLQTGGAEGMISSLSSALNAKESVNVKIFLLAGVKDEKGAMLVNQLNNNNVEVFGLEDRGIRNIHNIFKLLEIIRSWKPDIIQANLYSSEIFCSIARIILFDCKRIYVRRLPSTDYATYRNKYIKKYIGIFYDHTIACSSSVKDSYVKYIGKNISNISVIENGIDIKSDEYLNDKITTINNEYKLLKYSPIKIIHVGQFRDDSNTGELKKNAKAQDIVIKSFAKAFGKSNEECLVLVGGGSLITEAKKIAKNEGILNRVMFTGLVAEPKYFLKISDIFIFPSRYEGYPNALLEAACIGLPIIASNIREIIQLKHNDHWFLNEVDDIDGYAESLKTLKKELYKYKKISKKNAVKFRETYSINSCSIKYLKLYSKLMVK